MISESGTKSQGWWRWPLLPFAAVGGAIVGTAVVILFLWFGMKLHGGFTTDGWYFRYVMPVISSAMFGYLYTYISCVMAPRGQVTAGVIMATILGLFCLPSIVASWYLPNYSVGRAIQYTVGAVVTMIASVLTVVSVAQGEQTGA